MEGARISFHINFVEQNFETKVKSAQACYQVHGLKRTIPNTGQTFKPGLDFMPLHTKASHPRHQSLATRKLTARKTEVVGHKV